MAARTTPNGWAVLKDGDRRLTRLHVPNTKVWVTGRIDQLGFLVVFWLSFWNDKIERLRQSDTGVHNYRENTTAPGIFSEHAGAAAGDADWQKHPQGVPISRTFTPVQIFRIRRGIRYLNRLAGTTVATWGGEWPSHPGSTALTDGMHTQFVHGRVLYLVRKLAKTARGKAVLKANPHLKIKGVTVK